MEWKPEHSWHNNSDGSNEDVANPGLLLTRDDSYWCLTPGLTGAFSPGLVGLANIAVPGSHVLIHKHVSKCLVDYDRVDLSSEQEEERKSEARTLDGCYHVMDYMKNETGSMALRSRTVTSTGMKSVLASEEEGEADWISRQPELWETVARNFGTSVAGVRRMVADIESDRVGLLEDAYAGLCKPGHSCKPMAKKALRNLLRKARKKAKRTSEREGSR